MRRLAGVLLTAALVATACSDDDEDDVTAVETVEEETAAATEDVDEETEAADDVEPHDDGDDADEATDPEGGGSDATVAAWGDAVLAHWDQLQADLDVASEAFVERLLEIGSLETPEGFELRFDINLTWLDTHVVARRAAPAEPGVATLDPSYGAYLDAMDGLIASYQAMADAINADRDSFRDESVDARARGEMSRYDDLSNATDDADAALLTACFDLAEAMTAEALPLLNCAGSGDEGPEDPGDTDPTAEPTKGVARVALPAGTYELPIFEQPLTVTFDRDVGIRTRPRFLDIEAPELEGAPFVIIATDELADPNVPAFEGVEAWVPYPDDLGTWIDVAPLTVVATGTSTLGSIEAPWWQVDVDIEDALERGWAEFFPIYDQGSTIDTGVAAFAGLPVLLWQVDAPSGPVLIATQGDAGSIEAVQLLVEELLATAVWG